MTLTLEVGTYKWDTTQRVVMMHVSMKFSRKKAYLIIDLYQ